MFDAHAHGYEFDQCPNGLMNQFVGEPGIRGRVNRAWAHAEIYTTTSGALLK